MKNANIPGLDRIAIPKWVQKLLSQLILIYAIVGGLLFAFQRSFLYQPMNAPQGASALRSGKAQYWRFAAPDVEKSATGSGLCDRDSSGKTGAILYLPGNAEPASMAELYRKHFQGCDLYALDYPGYEAAPGSPSEASILMSSDAVYERMVGDGASPSRIILIGRSLGSGPAVYLASKHECLMSALLTPYENLGSVAYDAFPFFPAKLMTLDTFDASDRAPNARCPALFLAAENDAVVHERHAHALYKMWNQKLASGFSTNNKATHGNITDLKVTWDTIDAFAKDSQKNAQISNQKANNP